MRKTNLQLRRRSMVIGLAVLSVSSARSLRAQTTVIYEQNANGQAYSYTAPNGAMINGNFPSDNNWSQSLTYGGYGYSIGPNNYTFPYEIAPSNWSTDTYPNSTMDDIIIPGLPVKLDVSVSIDNLTINASGGVSMVPGTSFNIVGTTITDNGQIVVNSTSSNATTILNISGGTVSGTGSFVLNDSTTTAQLNGSLTQSAGHSILGYGQINAALINNGTVNADANNQTLYLQTSNMTNNSLFTASGGGTLYINGITVTQGTSGLISASGTGSVINLSGATISGGTLNTSGGAYVIQNSGGNPDTFASLTSNAQVNMSTGTTINVTGNLVDNGQILINTTSSNGTTILNISGGTVSGTGSFVLNGTNTTAQLTGSLTQSAGHSILGYGQVNAALTNNGTVNADVNNQTLFLQTSNMSNNATFMSANGGTLEVNGITLTQGAAGVINAGVSSGINFTNATINGGVINAANASTMVLNTSVLIGTTFNSATGATVVVQPGISSIGSLMQNPAGSVVNLNAGATLNITGSLVDNGTFVVNSGSSNATTILNFSGGSITGSGSFILNDSNTTAQLNGTLTQPAGHGIFGYGYVNAALTNNGTVNANKNGQTLYLQTSNMTNNSLFTASGGGTLYINGITVTQGTSGLISVGSGSAVDLYAVSILGGTLNSSAGTAITTVNSTTNVFSSITNNAQINLSAGSTINVTGNLVDNGQFLINSGSSNATTILNISGGTVSGTGSFVLNDSTTTAQLNGSLTQSAGHSILGYGQINAALINNGTVNADANNQTLYLQTSNMTNNSLFTASGGGTLYINGITVTQGTSGLISASGTGSVINLSGATISGGTLNTSGGAYVIQNSGGNPDTFASLTSNAQVNMSTGTTINVTGNLVDNGQILINTTSSNGTTILNISGGTVSGTGSFVLNGTNTTAQLTGSLTQSAGHSILGYGQVNAALTNNGTVNADVNNQTLFLQTSNMSNNATFMSANGGTLEVNGITLTQGAAGVINAGVSSGINFTNATINGGVINAANASTMVLNTSVLIGTTFNSATGATVVVQPGISSIGSLMQNPAGSVVNLNAGATLNITGSLVDNGTFVVNSGSSNATTILNFSGGSITGSGSFILNDSNTTAQLNGTLTQPAGHGIFGYGYVNAALTNNGTVNANKNGQTLYLQTSNMTNNSLFTASGGGTLYINGITVTQGTSGLISVGSGSAVDLYAVSILGGTLNSSAGTAITTVNSTTNVFSSITNNAQINLSAGSTINVTGNLVDNGQFLINSGSSNATTILNISGGTVSGTGSFVLNDSTTTAQLNGSLTQSAGHSILGYGQINAALINNGTVNADANNQTLYLQTSNMTNNSLFTASGGGTLYINGITVTQGTSGLISASGTGSVINLSGATISGGTLNTSGGAYVIQNSGGNPDTFASLTSNAQVNMSTGTTINVTGNLVDNGQILINTTSSNGTTILNISGGTVSGTGSFVLNGTNTTAQLTGSLTQSAGHSILGYGQVNAALTNNGTVNADVNNQTLFLQTSNMSNNATFMSANGGTLEVNGITLTQGAAGVINAGVSSGINFTNATINGGVINAANASTMVLNTSVLIGTTFNSATGATVVVQPGISSIGSLMQNPAGSVVNLNAGATLNITGSLVDNGTFVVNSGSSNATTILNFSGGSITGSGSFILNDSNTTAQLNGTLTQPAGHGIFGYGYVNAALTNNGTVNANKNGQTLYLQTSNMTNNSLFTASGGGTLYINGITVTQGTSGLISVGSGSAVDLYAVSILGGTLNSSAGTAITTVNSTTNVFSSVTNNAQINLSAGSTINVTGNLVDNGQFLINSGSSNATTILNISGGTVSGTGSFVLNDSTTTAQLNGSLTQSAGHSILGYGQINAALINNGTVNADANGQTLYLNGASNGTGNYQVSGGGTLNVAANLTISAPGSLVGAGAGSPVLINSGVSLIDNGSVSGLPTITDNGSLTFAENPNTGILIRSLNSLTLGGTATATVNTASNVSNRTLLVTSALSLVGNTNAWNSKLDLGNNDLDIAGASLATTTNQIKQGYNNGTWNGSAGIVSTAAAADTTHLTALAVIQNNQSGSALFTSSNQFDGITPGAGDILVKYTYYGDANLDGQVTSSDYTRIDNGYLSHLTGWYNGDFNYDGVVNGSDYTLIDNAFNQQGARLTDQFATRTSQIAAETNSVPEPASLSLIGLVALPILCRRSRFRNKTA